MRCCAASCKHSVAERRRRYTRCISLQAAFVHPNCSRYSRSTSVTRDESAKVVIGNRNVLLRVQGRFLLGENFNDDLNRLAKCRKFYWKFKKFAFLPNLWFKENVVDITLPLDNCLPIASKFSLRTDRPSLIPTFAKLHRVLSKLMLGEWYTMFRKLNILRTGQRSLMFQISKR